MKRYLSSAAILLFLSASDPAAGQSLGNAGTIRGKVLDPSGAVIARATAVLSNDLTLYRRDAVTSSAGEFEFTNIPPNVYHLIVSAPGFASRHYDLSIRSMVPLHMDIALAIQGQAESVTVGGEPPQLETTPSPHTDVDSSLFARMPTRAISSGLSDLITLATPAVTADSDGFFHALGDHAQMALSIDNQPITDQQGKLFSTQIPLNAIQSVEAVYGGTPAEFGDKTSLVVTAVTRSGLGQRPHGSLDLGYGSFGTGDLKADLAVGGPRWGQFFAGHATRSGRFLDSPERRPFHDIGNSVNLFSRTDYQPSAGNMFHLNLLAARNWFQIPNTFDQRESGQDQRQRVLSYNVAPGWIHVFGAHTALVLNPYLRQDQVAYYPSRNFLADRPGTLSQTRRLTNAGLKIDVSYARGRHTFKAGAQFAHTFLTERFSLGITDPEFIDPELTPGLVPYDLTRGGSLFRFHGHADIRQQAFYLQDSATLGKLTVNAGLRFDRYDGLSRGTQWQPRLGLAYLVSRTSTVLRLAYSHSYETPLNENLVLSSATGAGGLAANVFGAFASVPIRPGIRNQYNAGFEQALGRYLVLDGDYFWKFTRNAFDLDNLFNTAIYFPIQWDRSKMDGLSARLSLRQYKGLSAFTTLGHTRARVFGPEIGGLIFASPVDRSVVRIDHDQALQSTTQIQYQPKDNGPWAAFVWRYDSGIVSGAVPDLESVLSLTGDQQAQIGFHCAGRAATPWSPITFCDGSDWGAALVRIPAPGAANDDHNPARVRSRHLFDLAAGADNLFRSDRFRWKLRFEVLNLTGKTALYNFLSTCAGTHFVTPRAFRASVGIAF